MYAMTVLEPREVAVVRRESIVRLENHLMTLPDAYMELPVKHYFADGVYCREVFIKAGTILTGKIHKTEHINIISQGKVWVSTEATGRELFEAPHTYVSPIGSKKALYTLEDTIWTTVHPTETKDLDEIEDHIIAQTYDDYLLHVDKLKLLEKK